MLLGASSVSAFEPSASNDASTDQVIRWQFLQTVKISTDADTALVDLVLRPDLFTRARADLGDLRLYDNSNRPVPYALRVLRSTSQQETFSAEEFNLAAGPDNTRELTLDLKSTPSAPADRTVALANLRGSQFCQSGVGIDHHQPGTHFDRHPRSPAELMACAVTRGAVTRDSTELRIHRPNAAPGRPSMTSYASY